MAPSRTKEPDPTTSAHVVQWPIKHRAPADERAAVQSGSASAAVSDLEREYERFQLQVRLDVESERELLYKSLLVVEILALLFVLREMMIRWLA